ncbi:TetR/AcrR family transcriptional regulator [Pseudoteredinibacter isoporae]|nr:TetR/AcrR family transcriptional regulator [Pseudoteredinibacter isoporae]NHO88649.1 TetR/AcrR family transcriptional regulator [Pseudoteredinibacter isoporae]NIB22660.1 TetR/AcrR family transcriptional regulator [Pseudoteredinibacter isoporae]
MTVVKKNYHHGDLKDTLEDAAVEILREVGVNGLSMRKLADRVGVSRSAPYHHFEDKKALLNAIAHRGFVLQAQAIDDQEPSQGSSFQEQVKSFVHTYVTWAVEHPEYYDLMFGREVWQASDPPDDFAQESRGYFRRYVERVERWQHSGHIQSDLSALRFAQVSWSSLHGISRLLIDGIYVDKKAQNAICDAAADIFFKS